MYVLACHSVCLHVPMSVSACVTWGRNFASDSFIKCSSASGVAVNHFYFLCVGGQPSSHHWTPDTTGMDWLAFAIAAVLLYMVVIKGGLFLHGCSSPEGKGEVVIAFFNI